jgi:hypothetical protein
MKDKKTLIRVGKTESGLINLIAKIHKINIKFGFVLGNINKGEYKIMEENLQEEVKFNGKKITRQQLQEKIEESEKQPGVKIVEVKPNVFKKRIQG